MRDVAGMKLFAEKIWTWYFSHKRELPWRDLSVANDDHRAYLIWISEVMLQQTQVSRVEVLYKKFIREVPHVSALAQASNREVLMAWQGMGYNSRALRLRNAAQCIVDKFGGHFPSSMEDLQSIKGIGHYTAAAIRNFAFGLPTPCLDTNIRRILHRFFFSPERSDGTWKKNDKILLETAGSALAAAGKPRDWHAALMDFGSLVCTKRGPKCHQCPLRAQCASAFKVKVSRAKKKDEPGREIAGKFVPNRIIRGRIVEYLRENEQGGKLEDIGANVCIDWDAKEHREWLQEILDKLKGDALIAQSRARYHLNT